MNRIRQLRTDAEMKQSDLASRLSVKPNTISNWENGKTEPDFSSLQKMAAIFNTSVDYILCISNMARPHSNDSIKIPVLGDVAAGLPIEAITDIVDYEEIDTALAGNGEFFGLRLKGTSMEPRMREGDVVIVRKQADVESGDVAVVMVNGDSATVKKIKKGPSGITLIPNNPVFDPMFYTNDEIQSLPVRILGKVVELRAKF